ncbi:MAG: HIT family protein [Pseudomonadales bacterium]
MSFQLHPQLAEDTLPIATLTHSDLRLMNDARYPWCILVPRQPGLSSLHELPVEMRMGVFDEIARVSTALLAEHGVERVNVGALGNIVQQLHIHVVGRWSGDPAWPGPVWGQGKAVPWQPAQALAICQRLGTAFG